jgi:iron complex transport system ATP-binding protein
MYWTRQTMERGKKHASMDNRTMNEKRSLHRKRSPPLLEFKNITVIKGDTTVLDNLSITIDEGEHIAIMGPNGAGKSSFIKTITREYYPLVQDTGVTFRIRG